MHRILVVGGYGLVGGWAVRHLRAAGHDLDVVIGGRRPDEAAVPARESGARVVKFDTGHAEAGLAAAGPVDLVVSLVQDPDDNLLRATLRAGSAHLGIVRKADNVGRTMIAAADLAQRPAMIMGHWQAGVTTFATLAAAREFGRVERVELAALFDRADPTGPMTTGDSREFFDRALLRRDGRWENVEPTADIRTVDRGGPPAFDARPMGVLDVPALAAVTGAPNVRFDLGVGDSCGTLAGGTASHEIYADLWGRDDRDMPAALRTVVSDPLGQAHLTALGVLIGIERVLGLDGALPPGAGVVLPETAIDPVRALSRLRAFGVGITTVPLPAAPSGTAG
ncbi:hypothetical protein J2853_001681 [Streptosporangium lutulentum]|uniref:Saccharopine dehydrogenase n=1 Tax=Streptosporangium lutulentum TaxID=1461250 RepID=A0ABT9Q6T5_9ACTN|nr:hypothetical protein [Streptosporangium lutulentum]MDP9842470.1 hypothetical protein [Streptosporangium lutulentum]